MRPILPLCPLLTASVNQRLPSEPDTMLKRWLAGVEIGNSVIWPAVVIRPILPTIVALWGLGIVSVNQRALSDPDVMSPPTLLEGSGNAVIWPFGVMRPIAPPSVNQRLPSGPVVMLEAKLLDWSGNSVILPVGVMRPILPTTEVVPF